MRDMPRPVREIFHTWIPMRDGVRLAARIWLPVDADEDPVPGVLEYIPYRKNDLTALRDVSHHGYVAGHGYACVRVDLRGSGESEGVLTDEYLETELEDGVEVIRWLAQQPWCSGRVGMIGISWGGFNGLQIAALKPTELGAVITLCSTDDRYTDDVHYMGGCLLGDNLSWASTMLSYNSLPPDPAVVGDRWRDMWIERLEGSGLWLAEWLKHQRRDDYWRHGSVCEDYGAIECPVMAVSGWADGYSNAVFRLMEHLEVPRRGIVGPWHHVYPHLGLPGPAIGFLQEEVRWWDRWLKDVDNGVEDEPMVTMWMQESVPPATRYETRPGRWVVEEAWPPPNVERYEYGLAEGSLLAEIPSGVGEPLTIDSPLYCGLYAGKWCSYGAPPDLPHDQRHDDWAALTFDTEPVEAEIELLGAPVVELDLEVDRPVAMVAVRLSDVQPDGRATRITYGLLNLTHRDGHEEPRDVEPGRRYTVRIQMNEIAQTIPVDHRVRLSVSTVYWPLAWPSPEPVTLTLHPGTSRLALPVRAGPPGERDEILLGSPEAAPPAHRTVIREPERSWDVVHDLVYDEVRLEIVNDVGVYRMEDIDLEVETRAAETYAFREGDYDSVRGETLWQRRFRRGEWEVRSISHTLLTSDTETFRVQALLDVYEGETQVFTEEWDELIPRDHL